MLINTDSSQSGSDSLLSIEDDSSSSTSSTTSEFDSSLGSACSHESDINERVSRIRESHVVSKSLEEKPNTKLDLSKVQVNDPDQEPSPSSGGHSGSGGRVRRRRTLDSLKKLSPHNLAASLSPRGDGSSAVSPGREEKKSPKSQLSQCVAEGEPFHNKERLADCKIVSKWYFELALVTEKENFSFTRIFRKSLGRCIDNVYRGQLTQEEVDFEISQYIHGYIIDYINHNETTQLKHLTLTRAIAIKLFSDEGFYSFIKKIVTERLEVLLTYIENVLTSQACQNKTSLFVDQLLLKIDQVSRFSGETNFQSLFSTHHDLIEVFILKMFSKDVGSAKGVLERIRFWLCPEATLEVSETVERYVLQENLFQEAMKFRLNLPITDDVDQRLENVSYRQIANSYSLGKELNYECIKICHNKIDQSALRNMDSIGVQKAIFRHVMEAINAPVDRIDREIDLIYEKKGPKETFLGKDILWFGSDDGWDYCIDILKKNYPALFSSHFIIKNGEKHLFDVTDKNDGMYQVTATRSLYICQPQKQTVKKSRSTVNKKIYAHILIRWFYFRNAEMLGNAQHLSGSFRIDFQKIEQLDESDQEFTSILRAINIPVNSIVKQKDSLGKVLKRSKCSRTLPRIRNNKE